MTRQCRSHSIHYLDNNGDHRAHELHFDRLLPNDMSDNSVTSRLIEDFKRTEDAGKSLRLTIKDGINWHNGKKFTGG